MATRPPLPPEIASADGGRLYPLLNGGTDFTVILVALSYIDTCLTSLLSEYFRQCTTANELLDANKGAIGSLSAKANTAYVLGLIDKIMLQDLITLAQIRNLVAHSHEELDFSKDELIHRCEQLKYIKSLTDTNTGQKAFSEQQYDIPRNKFILTAITIWNRILLTALATNHVA